MIGQTRQLRPAQAPSFTSVNIPGCKQVTACDHYLQGPEKERAGKETEGNTSISCLGKSKSLRGCFLPTSQTPTRIGTVVGCHCWVRKKTEERLQIEFSNQGRWSVWSWPFSQDYKTNMLPSLVTRSSDDGLLKEMWEMWTCVGKTQSFVHQHVLKTGCIFLPSSLSSENCCSSTYFKSLESFFYLSL